MGQIYTAWSEREKEILRENSGKITAIEIGKLIGRGSNGVRKMAKKMGLPSWEQLPADKQKHSAAIKPVDIPVPETPKPVENKVKPPKPTRPLKPVEAKKAPREASANYPQVEWCPVCHAPVSNWTDHITRLGWYGCKMPAA
jgi:hypothetical protein